MTRSFFAPAMVAVLGFVWTPSAFAEGYKTKYVSRQERR